MKKEFIFLVIWIITAGIFPSCEKSGPLDKEPEETNTEESEETGLQKRTPEIIKADKAFGLELFRELCSTSESDNLMISPFSVSCALGMTYNGAAGTTLDAFVDVLHFENLTTREVNATYKDLMGQLATKDDKVELSIANSIWYRAGFSVLDEFIATNREYFDAAVEQINFSSPQSVDIINQWIEDKTNGKIQDMLEQIPDDAIMFLINALYFNAQWKYEFEEGKTRQGNFFPEDGSVHTTDYMYVHGNFNYFSNDDLQAVELPYGDSSFSMIIIWPSGENKVSDLLNKLDTVHWDSWFANPAMTELYFEMPKFKFDYKVQLNDPLINLGLGVAFSGEADFTRINPAGGIYISRVIHQTFIDVQEKGTEAAAVTVVQADRSMSGLTLIVDKPFLYFIKDNSTGAILFIGKVGKPEYS